MSKTKKVLWSAAGIWFIAMLLSFTEFQIWIHADSYPGWLSTPLKVPEYPPKMDTPLITLAEKTCEGKRGLMSFRQKTNGYFMRCDESLSLTAWKNGVYRLTNE
ncbi:hypothetical protein [Candidatus Pantoea formicae]|uniref:hypothetical protein n=1 Tax=Candidatus Pantoea formicae TaxID=2608355 RepID=UPI003EDABBA2